MGDRTHVDDFAAYETWGNGGGTGGIGKPAKGTWRSRGVDRVYCTCHQSVDDPYAIVRRAFTALPRPD